MGLTRPTAAQIDSTAEVITDPISMLNNKSTKANVDVGFLINRDGGISSNVAVFWQENTKQFVFALTTSNAVGRFSNIVVTSNANVQTGNVFTIGYINATGNVLAAGIIGNTITAGVLTANVITTVLTRGADNNFQLTAQNGVGQNLLNTEVARFGINYGGTVGATGTGWDSFIQYIRGSSSQNGSMSLWASNTPIANITSSGLTVAGYINSTGNILAAGASIFGNVTLGSMAVPGALNTLAGNVSILGVSSMLNIIGNIVVNNTSIASSNVTGAIRTTGGIGVGGNLYVGQRVGYVWGANNVSSVYQIFNNSTNSLDTVFG